MNSTSRLARALATALGHLDYYENRNPVMADNARYTIREVLVDDLDSTLRPRVVPLPGVIKSSGEERRVVFMYALVGSFMCVLVGSFMCVLVGRSADRHPGIVAYAAPGSQ